MRTVEQWLQEYGESHRDSTNKRLHWICMPRPSFFKDLQFLMIGPLGLLGFIYRKLRIPY